MKKLSLDLNALQVQSFETAAERAAQFGTVHGFGKKTGIDDTNCSAIDACVSRLCETYDPALCPTIDPAYCESADDACPSQRGCSDLFAC